ncbi:MAG: ATP-binding cassette domain-containing protein [Cyclobacteriaceae bacterium]|nr:ATP-binding cassette domain-containing protein [Cyclobacteriaceae bacterium]MCH8516708.1 ATP-binding cassette domain-containing protein [Cyclobacteriaceae bacterium]
MNEQKSTSKKISKSQIQASKRLYSYLRPYLRYFILGLICLFFSSTTLLAFPYVAGKLLDVATGNQEWIFTSINQIAIGLILILAIQSVFSFGRVYFFTYTMVKSSTDLMKDLFKHFVNLPLSFYDQNRTGELFSRVSNDVSVIRDSFNTSLAELIRQLITLLAGISIIFYTTPRLSLFMLLSFPFIIIVAVFFGRFIKKLSKETQQKVADSNVILEENLQNISVIKAFTGELYEYKRYTSKLNEAITKSLSLAKWRGSFISFIIFALFGGIVAIMWYGASLVQSGMMSVGELLSFILYTTFIGGSIAGIGDLYGQVQKAFGASERVLELLDEENESKMEVGKQLVVLKSLKQQIIFDKINFSYQSRPDTAVLKSFSLSIEAGQKVALVGSSGAGKSTLAQLLLRSYDIQEGRITIGGIDISSFPLKEYRSKIGVVPQDVILFGGSIRENIAYASPEQTEENIIEAAKRANAWEFICQLPEGLDSEVGERGVKLSGGQKQRIAIARAFLKNPDILILDEATSALDAASETLVQEALEEVMKNRTTIIIAHRLATVRKADQIFVMSQGEIIESGTHKELSQLKDGVYNNFVKLQYENQ